MGEFSDFSMLWYVGEFFQYASWTGAGYLAWRVVRAYERRSIKATQLRTLGKRVKRLEASVRRVDRRTASTAEAQEFTTALLLDRSNSRLPATPSRWAERASSRASPDDR
jgi:hypothetical protein